MSRFTDYPLSRLAGVPACHPSLGSSRGHVKSRRDTLPIFCFKTSGKKLWLAFMQPISIDVRFACIRDADVCFCRQLARCLSGLLGLQHIVGRSKLSARPPRICEGPLGLCGFASSQCSRGQKSAQFFRLLQTPTFTSNGIREYGSLLPLNNYHCYSLVCLSIRLVGYTKGIQRPYSNYRGS